MLIILVILFLLSILQLTLCSSGTLGSRDLAVNGKDPRNLLFIKNLAWEYDIPVIGVLRSSSKANCSSFFPSLAFLSSFLIVCRLRSASPFDCGYLGLDANTLKLHFLLNSRNSLLLNGMLLAMRLFEMSCLAKILFSAAMMVFAVLDIMVITSRYFE